MPIEIERKFLLRAIPEQWDLDAHHAELAEIEQWYVHVEDEFEERIRRTSTGSSDLYHHTYLTARKVGVREVQERTIGRSEYDRLKSARSPYRQMVAKRRWKFTFAGQIFTIDNIRSPQSRSCVIMEAELKSEDQEITLPPFAHVIREVTGERTYSNADIARG
jgi:CYTH domain-containing protein